MAGLEHAVKRIQALECPNGEVEERVSEILKEYDGTLENPVRFAETAAWIRMVQRDILWPFPGNRIWSF